MIDDALVLNPHIVTVTNVSNVASQDICRVPLSPLNPNSILYIPHCPHILISLN